MPQDRNGGWEPLGYSTPTHLEPEGPQSQLRGRANFVLMKPGLKCRERETPLLWIGDALESPAGGPGLLSQAALNNFLFALGFSEGHCRGVDPDP